MSDPSTGKSSFLDMDYSWLERMMLSMGAPQSLVDADRRFMAFDIESRRIPITAADFGPLYIWEDIPSRKPWEKDEPRPRRPCRDKPQRRAKGKAARKARAITRRRSP